MAHAKSEAKYMIYGFEVGNREGKGFIDVRYFSVGTKLNGQYFYDHEIPYNRPISEFVDGRFIL